MSEILSSVEHLLKEVPLCSTCLGRQFAQLLSGTNNKNRGESLIYALGMSLHLKIINQEISLKEIESLLRIPHPAFQDSYQKIASSAVMLGLSDNPMDPSPELVLKSFPLQQPCYICQGNLDKENITFFSNMIIGLASQYEFASYLVGSKIPTDMIEREENIRAKFNLLHGESIKSDFNREIGKKIQEELIFKEKELDFNSPDIVFVANIIDKMIEIQNNPLFIYGKYNKLKRGIPQTVWYCNSCWGKGCEKCDYTGRKHPDAIEEFILPYLIQACKAKSGKFHGSGREDVDARMLGDGRPFVAQINEPKIRNIQLTQVEQKIRENANGKVEVILKEFTDRKRVRWIKGHSSKMGKRYKMGILFQTPQVIDLNLVNKLIGEIEQQTPTRVLRRRADLKRIKQVFSILARQIDDLHLEVEIFCSGGLYVKELMHGDNGRTKPSLSEILGNIPIIVEYLDVLEVVESNK
ncbi:MAG: tRNA pseudouridine(54/55) synthase Pus10 [Candidatus Thorarchaeota archaeon]